jgi:tRNA modification GTPase
VAIVSAIPGTTRDAIEVRCDIRGLPVTFVDTAGLRETADPIEHAGIERTRAHIGAADLVLWLAPADETRSTPSWPGLTRPPRLEEHTETGTPAGVARENDRGSRVKPGYYTGLDEVRRELAAQAPILTIVTKADLTGELVLPDTADLAISAQTGAGLDRLIERVREAAEAGLSGGDALITRERHRVALEEVTVALSRAEAMLHAGHDELAAEDLRLALRGLGRITGQVDVEEVLDRIFGQFCIGK